MSQLLVFISVVRLTRQPKKDTSCACAPSSNLSFETNIMVFKQI